MASLVESVQGICGTGMQATREVLRIAAKAMIFEEEKSIGSEEAWWYVSIIFWRSCS